MPTAIMGATSWLQSPFHDSVVLGQASRKHRHYNWSETFVRTGFTQIPELKKQGCPSFIALWIKFSRHYQYTRILFIGDFKMCRSLTLILRRSRTGTVWFYTSTSNKRAARPKLYTKSLTRDLRRMYSRLTLVRIYINLYAPCVLYIRTGVSLLFRERFLYI